MSQLSMKHLVLLGFVLSVSPMLASGQEPTGFIVLRLMQGTGSASVRVDGVIVATLSAEELTLEQPVGTHELSVERPGFEVFRQRVSVRPGDVAVIEVRLIPTALGIREDQSSQGSAVQVLTTLRVVHLDPVNVGIRVNGRQIGHTPATLEIPVGDNEVALGNVVLCLRSIKNVQGFVRVRRDVVEAMRGVEVCGPAAKLPSQTYELNTVYGSLGFRGSVVRLDAGSHYEFRIRLLVTFVDSSASVNPVAAVHLSAVQFVATRQGGVELLYREISPVVVDLMNQGETKQIADLTFRIEKGVADRAEFLGLNVTDGYLVWPIEIRLK